jgi:hypothetical protein
MRCHATRAGIYVQISNSTTVQSRVGNVRMDFAGQVLSSVFCFLMPWASLPPPPKGIPCSELSLLALLAGADWYPYAEGSLSLLVSLPTRFSFGETS